MWNIFAGQEKAKALSYAAVAPQAAKKAIRPKWFGLRQFLC